MRPSFLKNASFLNAFWSVLEVIVFPVALLAATPLFLAKLGTNQYGLWMLINSSLAFLDMLGFGINETLIKYISAFRATNKTDKIVQLISSLSWVMLLAIVLGILFGISLSTLQPDLSWTSISKVEQSQFYSLIPLGFFGLLLKMIEMFNLSILRGFGRYDLASKFSLTSKLLIILCNVVLVLMGYSLNAFFWGIIVIMIVMCSVEYLYVSRRYLQKSISFKANWKIISEVIHFAKWSWLQVIFTTLSNQVDKLVVAFFVGLEELAYYSVGFLVFRQLYMVYQASINWLFPNISANQEQNRNLKRLFYNSNTLLVLGVSISLLVLFFASDFGFRLWLGEEKAARSETYILLFSAVAGLSAFSYLPSVFFMGSGNAKSNTLLDLASKSMNAICALAGYYLWGTVGLLYGLAFSQLLYIPFQRIFLFKNVLDVNISGALPSLFGLVSIGLYILLVQGTSYGLQWNCTILILGITYWRLTVIHPNPIKAIAMSLKRIASEVER